MAVIILTKGELELLEQIKGKLTRHFGKTIDNASPALIYKACAMTVRDNIMEKWQASMEREEKAGAKKLYYLSFEFLMGRSLGSNMLNLALTQQYRNVFAYLNMDMNAIEDKESDAGLGNGGLGRLAACFLDSLTTLELPACGASIRYEYGLFKQKIIDGYQLEQPDPWLGDGSVWEIPHPEEQVEVRFGGTVHTDWQDGNFSFRYENSHTVLAIPYDMPICGYDSDQINRLRLWSARAPSDINMALFNSGNYNRAVEEQNMAEVISKVLYPEDNHAEGKSLRLKQQYFFVSATMQWILKDFKAKHGSAFHKLHQCVVIHINDTHPALAIPELMRLLMDEEGLGWDEAYDIVSRVFAYTNHTIMSEALEKWPTDIFKPLLPRIYMILEELNARLVSRLSEFYPGDRLKLEYMSIIGTQGYISMANLCLACCFAVNGVSELHTKILTDDIFSDYYRMAPERFYPITNGVTFRRWIMYSNPSLAKLINEKIGCEWHKQADTELAKLVPYADDAEFKERFANIKLENKKRLAQYILEHNCILVDVNSIFDVQVKRLHEYKRQLLNVLHILHLYNRILENPNGDFVPRTFIFGAKASPGYTRAKLIIKLVNSVAELVNNDKRIGGKLKVVFIENYGVTLAEMIMAAADVSEQISTAGKEASGTGNMKLMLSGAVTVGTYDGANVEMTRLVGEENIYIFGLREQEVMARYKYPKNEAQNIYATNAEVRKVLNQLIDGTLEPDQPQVFKDIYHSLLFGDGYIADPYMVVSDFEDYIRIQEKLEMDYQDQDVWLKKAILNTAMAGFFSSDRTICEYNQKIWKLTERCIAKEK